MREAQELISALCFYNSLACIIQEADSAGVRQLPRCALNRLPGKTDSSFYQRLVVLPPHTATCPPLGGHDDGTR